MDSPVTVAIPTLNAGAGFQQTLSAIRAQRLDNRELELLVCDSESADETVGLARRYGARVISIRREDFSHGATRNLLMSHAQGDHVAFLTQDAVPASDEWLARLLAAFRLLPEVGLVFGRYQPRPEASLSVRRELADWFDSLSDGGMKVDVLGPRDRHRPPRSFLGRLGFFTDVNGCVARSAWLAVPFRHVAYAEDHLIAQDMLRAGFAKVYVPDAAVIHSHDYSVQQWIRRSFDEARAMREVYGWAVGPRGLVRNFRGNVMADMRCARVGDKGLSLRYPTRLFPVLTRSMVHHAARSTGAALGAQADRLTPKLVSRLSLEGRP